MDKAQQDAMKKEAGIEAAKLVKSGMIVGLGTVSTVRFLVDELGRRKQEEGLEFTGVTTSRRTQEQAEGYGIKIVNIDDVDHIDLHRRSRRGWTRTSTASRAAARPSCGRRSWRSTRTGSSGSSTPPSSSTSLASSRCRWRSFRSAPCM